MDPSGLMRFDLGEGPIEVELRSRDDDRGSVTYLLLSTYTGVRLSIAVRSAEHARMLSAGALAIAGEELSRSRDSGLRLVRRGAMSDPTRAKILDAARELCKTRGFSVQTREIARAAGVAEATLFRRFKRRVDLIEALLREILDGVDRRMTEIQQSHGSSAAELIRAMNDLGFEYVDRYGRLGTDMAAGDLPDELMHHLPTVHGHWAFMGTLIKKGIESGQFRADLNPRISVVMWRALISTTAVEIMQEDSGLKTTREIGDAITTILVAAFS